MDKLVDTRGILLPEVLEKFEKMGDNVSCECPAHLVNLLRSVQEFTKYQEKCINLKPQDELVHDWLKATSINMEHLLSSTIVNLARMEGHLDDQNNIIEDD